MPRPTPFLWFDDDIEDVARFYTSIFPNSHIDKVVRAATDVPGTPKGDVLTVEYTLDGQPFVALHGGPDFTFNESVSFVVECQDQAEVDRYWDSLAAAGGEHSVCGWLKDKYGLSWQVVPRQLNEMMESSDQAAAARATEAMLKMTKIDIEVVKEAYERVPAGSR